MADKFTPTQGRYLAFINHYIQVHGVSPAEADLLAYFRTSPPSVHQMVVTLERNGLISRIPGRARSIQLLVPQESIPDLKTGKPRSLRKHPRIESWLKSIGCSIELGFDPSSTTYARVRKQRQIVWSGGEATDALDDLLSALELGIASLSR